MNRLQYLGVDGCAIGWISAETFDLKNWKISVFPTIQDLWKEYLKAELILIDIPIGLRDEGPKPRLCDSSARDYLTRMRSSSIFPTPCRSVLTASTYQEANKLNRERTGKGLSKQTWNITGKIKEVDDLLRKNADARGVFIESHPELCFTALSDGEPMQYYKKKEEGKKERIALLKNYYNEAESLIYEEIKKYKSTEVELDDIFDAMVLGLCASFGHKSLKYIPSNFEYDSENLPMRMAIPEIKKKSLN